MTKLTTIALSVIVAGFIASQTTAIGRPPNIVVIMTDDQSWNGTSVEMIPGNPLSKSDYYQTPRLEELAARGMVFSSAYSAASLCSPTRAALMTGRSPAQLHMTDIVSAGLPRSADGFPLTPPEWSVIDRTLDTLPRRVQAADPNYHVGHVGKWHVSPNGVLLGFSTGTYDLSNYLYPGDPGGIFGNTQSAINFLDARANDDKPFFLNLAYVGVHEPVQSRPETLAKYQSLPPGQRHTDPLYAAYTEDLDTGIGMVLDRLDALGMTDNTYVIFTADNGGSAGVTNNSPLLSGKNNLWEGGIRVPQIITGPGITPGSASHVPTSTADIYATVSALSGNTTPFSQGVEGASLTPLLFNGGELPDGQQFLERQYADKGAIFWHSPHYNDPTYSVRSLPSSAMRMGDYKLVLEHGSRGLPDKVYLFNLTNSLTESTQVSSPLNLANQLPEKRDEMLGMLRNWLNVTDANMAQDISKPVHLDWHADRTGTDPLFWKSPTNVDYNYAESWFLEGSGTQRVTLAERPYQPGLSNAAFRFDPNDAIKRIYFQVGDAVDSSVGNVAPASLIDHDRSATFDFWVRFDSLTAEQVLFEAGHSTEGLSITIGDADIDGKYNDLRLRVLGDDGKFINTTVQLDKYVDPKSDYVHIAAVMNDSPTDRYAALYVNGALLGRVNGLLGAANSIDWDGYLHLGDELATIGRESGGNLGGNSGPVSQRPFSGGGLRADLTQFNFRNYALSDAEVRGEYNELLAPVGWGVIATSGSALKPGDRPSNVAQDAYETNGGITILHERLDKLSAPLAVDVVPTSGATHGLISGSFTFAAPVLGVMLSEASLTAADRVLGVIGQYDQADRVLTADESATIQLSVDLRTLTISLTASAADFFEFRVLTAAPNLMPGDFNGDGFVSMADYDQWKHDYGSQSYLSDANHDGRVDAADYTIWRDHLGSQLAQASAVEGSAVPEPVTSAMLVATALGWLGASRMRRTRAA